MGLKEILFGKRIRTEDEQQEKISPLPGIPILGLDALASAAYGPEAALTVLLPLGVAAPAYIGPITLLIILLLFAVSISYRQTIAAYPQGGGSFTVAKENLGQLPGLLAASALSIDYVLNVAVAISAGVGALVSAIPSLLPYTLSLCMVILAVLTIVNLRGVRSAGIVFMFPTYVFLLCLGITIVIGIVRTSVRASRSDRPATRTGFRSCCDGLASDQGLRERLYGAHRHRGRKQCGSDLPETGSHPGQANAFNHHDPAGGSPCRRRVSLLQLRNQRHAARSTRISEHPLADSRRGRGTRYFLLRVHVCDSYGTCLISQHQFR